MRTVDIIRKKRNGEELTKAELSHLIEGYCRGDIPDYQAAAWAMAVYFQGQTARETAILTELMAHSGDTLDLSDIPGIKVDKHSTGGVGDKTTLIIAPLVAAAGVPVAKMSGRGLGHTGGTIDKLEAIPGLRTELSRDAFMKQVREIGLAVMGQSGNMTPADKQLYALRDVTATVESVPLIASSIMSKKIAAGADRIVLDVKVGSGAFMKKAEAAEELASAMVAIGEQVGRHTSAIISDMDQPLGQAIGNALEVEEAIRTLRGEGPADLTALCLELAAQMIVLGGKANTASEAKRMLETLLQDGSALAKLREMVAVQGGDPAVTETPQAVLPQAATRTEVVADADGVIQSIDAEQLGSAAMHMGAGRATKTDAIDYAAGIIMLRKVGDRVAAGETIALLCHNKSHAEAEQAVALAAAAYRIGEQVIEARPLVLSIVTSEGIRRLDPKGDA
ncbi:pyrimidine-nucleoside phosphorylase [Paenibacillus sp. 598K]|uniref:pyrimidine-nucleoside phosphorylase n=1 Tax=Paenibacillus sp. 598K TaxID=1117987 RepID=UPI000FF95B8E|nr:pyrimidine-nucleoside phosphorylase [Paenibacillus sp. 598K]GBF72700.1 pyrimidine-nucleoside phosphorylase [Paenibacillus sp. 598K]